jgi:hypothetical protein
MKRLIIIAIAALAFFGGVDRAQALTIGGPGFYISVPPYGPPPVYMAPPPVYVAPPPPYYMAPPVVLAPPPPPPFLPAPGWGHWGPHRGWHR